MRTDSSESAYPTVLKAVTLIRKATVANSVDAAELLSGEVELDEASFGGSLAFLIEEGG